jgi:hypothetical protein
MTHMQLVEMQPAEMNRAIERIRDSIKAALRASHDGLAVEKLFRAVHDDVACTDDDIILAISTLDTKMTSDGVVVLAGR